MRAARFAFSLRASTFCWKTTSRNTGGEWYTPQKYGSFKLKLEYKKGVLCVYINGLLDQKIEIQ